MRFLALANLFILLVFIPTIGCAQQEKPEIFANLFYQSYLKLNVRGLPDEKELKLLSPYLSEDLRLLFEKAKLEQKRFIAENPFGRHRPGSAPIGLLVPDAGLGGMEKGVGRFRPGWVLPGRDGRRRKSMGLWARLLPSQRVLEGKSGCRIGLDRNRRGTRISIAPFG